MKRNTTELILVTALDLFNKKGLAQVTLRTIAQQMGISQGNLNYHFKKRSDVIEALYSRLIQEINYHMSQKQETENLLEGLMNRSSSVMLALFSYRFILLDFVQIMRENRKIKSHFAELQLLREKQFMEFFELLIQANLMHKERLPNEYKNLYYRLQILGDFWISSAEIAEDSVTSKSISKYEEIINQTLFPYLTEKGKAEYQLIMGS